MNRIEYDPLFWECLIGCPVFMISLPYVFFYYIYTAMPSKDYIRRIIIQALYIYRFLWK